MVFQPFDPNRSPDRPRRFKAIPVRTLVPNVITLLALCAGLTAIRVAFEGKLELALGAIVFAALLDGIDGRIARMIKGTSKFGAELDSLADFVNFGCAPALILYFWGLNQLAAVGWIAALVFAICAGLRLARFNVMIDDPNKPAWAGNFFTGIPAPAGAITVLLPIYLNLLGMTVNLGVVWIVFFYVLAIGLLMVSRLPVFSGKQFGKRVPPEMVLPIFVIAVSLLRAADQLSVAGSQHRHLRLSGVPAARLCLLSQLSAQRRSRGRNDERRAASPMNQALCPASRHLRPMTTAPRA